MSGRATIEHPPDIVTYLRYASTSDKYRVHQFKSEDGFHAFKECARYCSRYDDDIHIFWRGEDGRLEGDGYRVSRVVIEKVRELLGMPPPDEDMWALFQLTLKGDVFEIGERTSFESTGPWGAVNKYYDIFENLEHYKIPLDDPRCVGLQLHGRPPVVVFENRPSFDKAGYMAVFQFRFKAEQ